MNIIYVILAFSCLLNGYFREIKASPSANTQESAENFSITERFLNKFPLQKIISSLEEDGLNIDPFLEIFSQAIAQEKAGFFGYHATTMKHWLFNEIIKQVLILEGHPFIQNDFYFLRSPENYDEKIQDIKNFLSKCLEKRTLATIEEKKRFISLNFLKVIDKDYLLYDDQTANFVFEALLFFSPISSKLTEEEAKNRLIAFVGTADFEKWLENRFQRENFLKYMDLLTVDEILELNNIYCPVADTLPWQQRLLVSLNIPLFGNFSTPTESTVHVFMKGESIDMDIDEILNTEVQNFLASHGFPKKLGEEIFEEVQFIINLKQGILLQFFDDPAYSHLDLFTFPCTGFNSPSIEKSSLNLLSNLDPEINTEQLRLLITKETLDPKSAWLKINQYDLVPLEKKTEVRRLIEKKLKVFQKVSPPCS